jgi:hypothetical protein
MGSPYNFGALKLSNLVQTDRCEEDLPISHIITRVARMDHPCGLNESAARQKRNSYQL